MTVRLKQTHYSLAEVEEALRRADLVSILSDFDNTIAVPDPDRIGRTEPSPEVARAWNRLDEVMQGRAVILTARNAANCRDNHNSQLPLDDHKLIPVSGQNGFEFAHGGSKETVHTYSRAQPGFDIARNAIAYLNEVIAGILTEQGVVATVEPGNHMKCAIFLSKGGKIGEVEVAYLTQRVWQCLEAQFPADIAQMKEHLEIKPAPLGVDVVWKKLTKEDAAKGLFQEFTRGQRGKQIVLITAGDHPKYDGAMFKGAIAFGRKLPAVATVINIATSIEAAQLPECTFSFGADGKEAVAAYNGFVEGTLLRILSAKFDPTKDAARADHRVAPAIRKLHSRREQRLLVR
ncbi:MAG: hypothetical protein AB7G80_01850 [Dongiaceae bacterium]